MKTNKRIYIEANDSGRKIKAKKLVDENPNINTEDLAESCGFMHAQSFTRAFVRWYGMTLTQYRKDILGMKKRTYYPRASSLGRIGSSKK